VGPEANASYLSGLLIGTELAALQSVDSSILLCAGERLRGPYRAAADALGLGRRLSMIEAEPLAPLGQSVILDRILSGK
jgi:2-keto-3-deoxy-galactonokinase